MGFAVASKGAPLAGLLRKFLLAAPAASAIGPASVAGACRIFNTRAPPHRRDDDYEFVFYDSCLAPGFFYPSSAFGLHPFVERGCWVSKDDDGAVELKVAMLGLGKEQLKVSAYQNALLVKAEGVKGSDGDEDPAWYSCRINLSAEAFKLDQTKAEMKDGLLTITMPKIKVEVNLECTDIKALFSSPPNSSFFTLSPSH